MGIDHVRLYVSDANKARDFYSHLYGVRSDYNPCYQGLWPCFTIGWANEQRVVLAPTPAGESNSLAKIVFRTENVEQMRQYLTSKGIAATKITKDKSQKNVVDAHFEVRDPEGHSIAFIQIKSVPIDDPGPGDPWFVQIIHAGFIVHDREKMQHFYKDILGFRPYWHGGMKDDETNWVSLQVPDGSDWIEFMLGVPDNADQRLRGIMNHIALGVKDIHAAQEQLRKNGAPLTEEPKIGRDGKWQLNLYDPDQTRIEFMEFTPVQKPCCSDFTAPHPKP